MSSEDVAVIPRFMGEDGQRFFTLQFLAGSKPKAHIVFVPPFGEEMNRCRSLVATQARSFARAGYSCTLVDFYGTGESQGQLRDATLTLWESNIREVTEVLQRDSPAPLILWGLRLGGLLALHFSRLPGLCPSHIILWQPVNSAFSSRGCHQRGRPFTR